MFTELHYSTLSSQPLTAYERLRRGEIVVVRQCPELLIMREVLASWEQHHNRSSAPSKILEMIDHKQRPSIQTIMALYSGLRRMRQTYFVPTLLADLVRLLGFSEPMLLEVGLNRLVLPVDIGDQIQSRKDLFMEEDFQSRRHGPLQEIFYVRKDYGQPHRELDQPHSIFQSHLWFPLHDMPAEESLLLFPDYYREDILVDRGQKHLPVEEWGLGKPLQIALKAGDMILFHSEHIHGSVKRKDETIRLSYDFRVITDCPHDHGWHHQDFWNYRNFVPAHNNPAVAGERAVNILNSCFESVPSSSLEHFNRCSSTAVAQQYVEWVIYNLDTVSQTFLEELPQVFAKFPFAEDRYLTVAWLCWPRNNDLARSLLETVCSETSSYYWAWRGARLAAALGCTTLANQTFNKAAQLCGATKQTLDSNPTPYRNGRRQTSPEVTPEVALNFIEQDLQALQEGTLYDPNETQFGFNAPLYGERCYFREKVRF
ncbi:MAG: hypothetical protein KDD42_01775 [Bdellovibrionales bacterium]|nr:hypothetical protein [Bdellovibrionales bacterium]